MSKPTASAAGDAMAAEGQKTRRAALGLFAGAPALAILPAIAIPSIARLSALIEAHRAAQALIEKAAEAMEAAEPDPNICVSYLGMERPAIGNRSHRRLIEDMELMFQFELHKLSTLAKSSPELGAAARGALETEKAAYLAQLDEVFAGHVRAAAALKAPSTPREPH